MLDVLAIGELNPDLILSGFAVNWPMLGTEQSFETQTLTLGSSTAIACVLMQRLGLRTAMAARVGNDEHGRFCIDALVREGVDVSSVQIDSHQATGITVSLSYLTDRMLLTRYGTMTDFGQTDIDATLLAQARHLHVGSFFIQSGLRPNLPDLFAAAQARGQTTSLDFGWDPSEAWSTDILKAVLPHVSIVFPNRVELASVTNSSDIAVGLKRLHTLGATHIALKNGAEGSIWSNKQTITRLSGFPADVVDTTGAGDSFNAGFLRGWLSGMIPDKCLALGNACGALTTQKLGGTGGLTNMMQVEMFLQEHGMSAGI